MREWHRNLTMINPTAWLPPEAPLANGQAAGRGGSNPTIWRLGATAVCLLGLPAVAKADPFMPPAGLAPGSTYRLVFVTSTTNQATDTDIGIYNSFVSAAA